MVENDFHKELDHFPVDVTRAALYFAQSISYPDLDVQAYMSIIDWLADSARPLISHEMTVANRSKALAEFLFKRMEFRGNTRAFSDPRNSYLNEVIDRRLGIPITLSVIFMAVARRLGLVAYGLGLPGHFIVSIRDYPKTIYLDPFNGGIRLTRSDCLQLVKLTSGYDGTLQEEWLQPSTPEDILTRMLNNLRNAYVAKERWDLAISVVEHLRMLRPDLPDHLRDLGLMHYQTGEFHQTLFYLEQYLLRAPDATDTELVRKHLNSITDKLARLN